MNSSNESNSIHDKFKSRRQQHYSFLLRMAFWKNSLSMLGQIIIYSLFAATSATIGFFILPVLIAPFALIGTAISFAFLRLLQNLHEDANKDVIRDDLLVLEENLTEKIQHDLELLGGKLDSEITKVDESNQTLDILTQNMKIADSQLENIDTLAHEAYKTIQLSFSVKPEAQTEKTKKTPYNQHSDLLKSLDELINWSEEKDLEFTALHMGPDNHNERPTFC